MNVCSISSEVSDGWERWICAPFLPTVDTGWKRTETPGAVGSKSSFHTWVLTLALLSDEAEHTNKTLIWEFNIGLLTSSFLHSFNSRGFWFWGIGKMQHKDPYFWAWEAKVFKMDLVWPNNPVADGLCKHRWVSVLAMMTLLTNDKRLGTWFPPNPISASHVESLKIEIYEVPGIISESICSLP